MAGNYSLLVTIGSAGSAEDLGYHTVEESLASANIKGSPFFVQVAPASFYAKTTYATGLGVFSATAGRDRFGDIWPHHSPLHEDSDGSCGLM